MSDLGPRQVISFSVDSTAINPDNLLLSEVALIEASGGTEIDVCIYGYAGVAEISYEPNVNDNDNDNDISPV